MGLLEMMIYVLASKKKMLLNISIKGFECVDNNDHGINNVTDG